MVIMVNALLWDLPSTLYNPEETNLVVEYVQQIHFLHGFETIFVSENIYDRIAARRPYENDYLRKLPNFQNSLYKLLEKVKHELDSILWNLKKIDHIEAQLNSFVSLYSKWVHALSLEAVVVLPMMVPTSSVSHFFHILVSDKRDFIGHLADDLELWLLSRFANVPIRWPYYLNFSEQIKENLSTQFDLDQFKDLRTEICKYPTTKQEEQTRKKLLREALEFNKSIMEFSMTNYPDSIVLTRSAIGVSNENLLASERLNWHHPKLMKILQEPILNSKGFVPCFVPDKLYSLELIRRIQPLSSLRDAIDPLKYAVAELLCDKNVDFALENFKKRLDIKRTS